MSEMTGIGKCISKEITPRLSIHTYLAHLVLGRKRHLPPEVLPDFILRVFVRGQKDVWVGVRLDLTSSDVPFTMSPELIEYATPDIVRSVRMFVPDLTEEMVKLDVERQMKAVSERRFNQQAPLLFGLGNADAIRIRMCVGNSIMLRGPILDQQWYRKKGYYLLHIKMEGIMDEGNIIVHHPQYDITESVGVEKLEKLVLADIGAGFPDLKTTVKVTEVIRGPYNPVHRGKPGK